MPLFEYQCASCDQRFEEFILGDARPRCPGCRSRKLRKLLSVFAVGAGGGGAAKASESGSACVSCGDPRGPGSCEMN